MKLSVYLSYILSCIFLLTQTIFIFMTIISFIITLREKNTQEIKYIYPCGKY